MCVCVCVYMCVCLHTLTAHLFMIPCSFKYLSTFFPQISDKVQVLSQALEGMEVKSGDPVVVPFAAT